ncbi:hypothetical protein RchiOBHm_Chr7g0228081 [Rosa chinensis]|uniref:Uncharacterized protein n=1 Tax=Rosa chinensis TaxID=74649 RepID=A0A2P6PES9_ROSCH|nr:hypothetical protein RchiOBHm_Chr7g0228081 [Rosa chinensis]
MLDYPIDWESQPYLSEDYVKEDDEENYDEDDNSDTENDHDEDNYVDDDYSDDEAGPSRSYRSLKRMRSDFKEWFQEKCARLVKDGSCAYNASPEINCCNETIELRQQPVVLEPVDAESPNRVSGFPIGFTPSPSHAHFVLTQIASSSQGGPENVCTRPQCMGLQALYQQQQMLIQQLQSENKELQRQVILSQQPNQNVVERNFLQQCIPPESPMTTQGPDDKLVNIPGLEELKHLKLIEMEGCNNITASLQKFLLQGQTFGESGGVFSLEMIFLSGSSIWMLVPLSLLKCWTWLAETYIKQCVQFRGW